MRPWESVPATPPKGPGRGEWVAGDRRGGQGSGTVGRDRHGGKVGAGTGTVGRWRQIGTPGIGVGLDRGCGKERIAVA
jgi:hypothetical protein